MAPDAAADLVELRDLSGSDAGALDMSEDAAAPADAGANADAEDAGQTGLRDRELLTALRRDAEATMTSLGYNLARDRMYAVGGVEDRGGRIEGLYTGRTVDTDGTRTPSVNCELADGSPTTCAFNTEHVVPREVLRREFGDGTPDYNIAEGDLHHLYPSDALANNARANFDFGESDCQASANCAFDEGSQLGLPVGGVGPTSCPMGVDAGEDLCVMQVRPERRGDVARAVIYMSMRYSLDLSANLETVVRTWHAADGPDSIDMTRNDAVEQAQGNRNPFVDDPTLVDRIVDF